MVQRDGEIVQHQGHAAPPPRLAHEMAHDNPLMRKVERGEHMPTLAIIFKIASALECSTAVLMTATEGQLTAAQP